MYVKHHPRSKYSLWIAVDMNNIISHLVSNKLELNKSVVGESKAFDLPEPRNKGILKKSNNKVRKFCVRCQENPRTIWKFTCLQSMEYWSMMKNHVEFSVQTYKYLVKRFLKPEKQGFGQCYNGAHIILYWHVRKTKPTSQLAFCWLARKWIISV